VVRYGYTLRGVLRVRPDYIWARQQLDKCRSQPLAAFGNDGQCAASLPLYQEQGSCSHVLHGLACTWKDNCMSTWTSISYKGRGNCIWKASVARDHIKGHEWTVCRSTACGGPATDGHSPNPAATGCDAPKQQMVTRPTEALALLECLRTTPAGKLFAST